jgi:pimeloyl-ACP methyl ester carboxylesterase
VGAARLATAATAGVTTVVEGVHQSVLGTLGRKPGKRPGQTTGITGWVYQAVREVTHLVGHGVDAALASLQPLFAAADRDTPETPQRQALLAALNGVLGDHLASTGNPLATPMAMRCQGQTLNLDAPIQLPGATGKLLLLIHGLCMNDLQWSVPLASGGEHNHGTALAKALGYTPVYLRYNTGLPISDNGRALSGQMTQLLRGWPLPVTDLSIVGHSMGGLVMRSAFHHAQRDGADWSAQVRDVVFLGTPHLGAPLEKAGHWVDVMLGSTPYSRPLAQLGKVRSVGITDLRHGRIADGADSTPLDLPSHIASYAVAATLAGQRSLLADRLLGDGLVPLPSALAHGAAGQRIVYKTGHIELLGSSKVAQQLIDWMR